MYPPNLECFSIPSSYYANIENTFCECFCYSGPKRICLLRKELVIGVSLPTQREERWIRDKEAMENEAKAKAKGVILKLENAEFNADMQVNQIEKLISLGIV